MVKINLKTAFFTAYEKSYFVIHPVEDVRHGRDHRGFEQPDVVVEESHVAGIETDGTAGIENGDLDNKFITTLSQTVKRAFPCLFI